MMRDAKLAQIFEGTPDPAVGLARPCSATKEILRDNSVRRHDASPFAPARCCFRCRRCRAQTFPDRPIRLLIPYAAGGSTDNMARVLQEPLQKALGQSVIVDNKAGAGGALAAREVIRAKPDGYTLFFVNNGNLAVVPFVQKDANYDGQKDFTSVALVSSAPLVAVIPAALPVTDLKGFIEYAKKNPVSYASAGIGSFGQLATELLASKRA